MARLQAHGVRAFAVPFLATLLLAACGAAPGESPGAPGSATPVSSGGPGSSGGPVSTASAGDVEAATVVLNAARLADVATLDALEGIRFTEAGTAAASAALTVGAAADALWAATYVYASAAGGAASDPAPLLGVAANATASVSVKAMAGAGLLAMGKSEGFAPLVAALDGSAALEGSEPRTTAWEFAASVLERYTAAGLPAPVTGDEAERASIAAAWTAWLVANTGKLRFDVPTQLWVPA